MKQQGKIMSGVAIRELRHTLGLSQVELAEWVGVSQPAVAQWETGATTPRGSVLRLLGMLQEKAEQKTQTSVDR